MAPRPRLPEPQPARPRRARRRRVPGGEPGGRHPAARASRVAAAGRPCRSATFAWSSASRRRAPRHRHRGHRAGAAAGARRRHPLPALPDVVPELASPAIFENRRTYRLLDADLTGWTPATRPSPAAGSSTASTSAGRRRTSSPPPNSARYAVPPLRARYRRPVGPGRAPGGIAAGALTLRYDRAAGTASFPLHCRDPALVGHAGGMYQVIPVGDLPAVRRRAVERGQRLRPVARHAPRVRRGTARRGRGPRQRARADRLRPPGRSPRR